MSASMEMPRYKSHKVIHALQIKSMVTGPVSITLNFVNENYAAIEIADPDGQRIRRACMSANEDHSLIDTGYLVVYADGYRSWSPTQAFEEGYTLFSKARAGGPYDFSGALHQLKDGRLMRRAGWNGPDQFIYLVPGSHFEVNRPPLLGIYAEGTPIDYLPHIDIRNQQGQCVPWLASQGDLLADDWELVELVP